MGFPDRIERTVRIDRPLDRVWSAITTAEGLGIWFGHRRRDRPSGRWRRDADLGFGRHGASAHRAARAEDDLRLHLGHQRPARGDPRRTYVEFTLIPDDTGTTVTVVESGFAQLDAEQHSKAFDGNTEVGPASSTSWSPISMADQASESVAEAVFAALADPNRRAILAALAAGGPATATDLAATLPITRQGIAKHLALLADAGLVATERRRAAPGSLPAAVRADAGRAAVPRRTGPRLGWPAGRTALPSAIGIQHQSKGMS